MLRDLAGEENPTGCRLERIHEPGIERLCERARCGGWGEMGGFLWDYFDLPISQNAKKSHLGGPEQSEEVSGFEDGFQSVRWEIEAVIWAMNAQIYLVIIRYLKETQRPARKTKATGGSTPTDKNAVASLKL
ncbi:hypothetical protein FOCC_FOCC002829 [Frankliniella occidentalis]|nr:hypothetical protein FOCC_FOCC002829 [Frankliniella occidentalis]